ncbi:MAG: OsmC family protein, partial [Gemmatimonadaceae bacterium]
KRKTPAESLDIEVIGDRAPETPAKLTRIHLTYTLKGAGIDRENAERAIELSINKYCSVKESLNQNIVFEWTLVMI